MRSSLRAPALSLRPSRAAGFALAGCGWLLAALLSLSGEARAQDAAPENGIRMGAGRLHASFALESAFDSNVGLSGFDNSQGITTVGPPGDAVMHYDPALKLVVPSDALAIDGAASLDYNQYLGLEVAGTQALSYLGGDLSLSAQANPKGKVALDIHSNTIRSNTTRDLSLALGALSLYDDTGAELRLLPGGGALEAALSYDFDLELFQSFLNQGVNLGGATCQGGVLCDPTQYNQLNYDDHTFGAHLRWRFFPKTAVVVDGTYGLRIYPTASANVPSTPLQVTGGLAGLVTPHVTLIAKGGWGKTFLGAASPDAAADWSGFIGQFQVGYALSDTAGMHLGYLRSFGPVSGSYGFDTDDRFYADAGMLFGGRVLAQLQGSMDFVGFGSSAAGTSVRSDSYLTASASVDYQLSRWLHLQGGYEFDQRTSSAGALFNYVRSLGFLRLTATY